jgi:leucine-rich repeat kinase 2
MEIYFTEQKINSIVSLFVTSKSEFLKDQEIAKLNAFLFTKMDRLTAIPTKVFKLVNLTILDLSYQAIKTIPDEIEALKNLIQLYLNGCLLLESISPKLGTLKHIKTVDVDRTISLKTPPPEICKRGSSSIIGYLKRLSSGSVLCKRTKLMLVGLGEAGKTSLLNSLMYSSEKDRSPERPQLTDGISIKDWTVRLPDESELVYSMWDFAGQSIYYNSHQFFLSSRAVYLLVWNVRLGAEYAGLEFWLNSIRSHAPSAPIFLVGTHVDEVAKIHLNKEKLKSRYYFILHFISFDTNLNGKMRIIL